MLSWSAALRSIYHVRYELVELRAVSYTVCKHLIICVVRQRASL